MSCATYGCSNPECPVCSVPRRFARVIAMQHRLKDNDGLRDGAPALNGTKDSTLKKGSQSVGE